MSAILPAKTDIIISVFPLINLNKDVVCFNVKTAVTFIFTPCLFSLAISFALDFFFVFIIGIFTKTFFPSLDIFKACFSISLISSANISKIQVLL